jgi:hypothetical protein
MKPNSNDVDQNLLPDKTNREIDRRRTTAADRRLARIAEYEQQSLQNEDPLEGCLGAQNVELMRIALPIEEAIKNMINKANGDLNEILKWKPGFDIYAALIRQVDRFANLELRLAESNRQAETELDGKPLLARNLSVQRRRVLKA